LNARGAIIVSKETIFVIPKGDGVIIPVWCDFDQ
jgi:hypothetical protein